jgi:hypothetical protein
MRLRATVWGSSESFNWLIAGSCFFGGKNYSREKMAIPRGSRWFGDGESKIKHPKTFARSHLTLRNISLAKKHVKINATQPLLLGKSIDLPYNRPDIFGSGKISVDLGLAGGERGWGRVCPAPQCTGLISLSRNTKERAGIRSWRLYFRQSTGFDSLCLLNKRVMENTGGWKEGVVKREIRDGVFEFFAIAINWSEITTHFILAFLRCTIVGRK